MSSFAITPDETRHDALRAAQWDLLRGALRYAQRDAQEYAERDVRRYIEQKYDESTKKYSVGDSTIPHLRYRITARSHVFGFVMDLYNFASELRLSYGALCEEAGVIDKLAYHVGNLAHGMGDAKDYEGAQGDEAGNQARDLAPIYPRDHWATAAHIRCHVTARSDLFLVTTALVNFACDMRARHGECGAAEKADRMANYVEELAHGLGEDYQGAEDI